MKLETLRVAWHEGLFMRPQHLQQAERYLEWLFHARLSLLTGFGFGFNLLTIDEALRTQGKLGIDEASGILDDGTPFVLPVGGRATPLEIAPGTIDATVHLCAVRRLPGAREFRVEGASTNERRARYTCRDVKVVDNTNESSSCDVALGALAMTLALEGKVDGSMTSLPVARVKRRAPTGELELDNNFIPPALSARAHARLFGWIEELAGLVKLRGDAQANRFARQGEKPYDFLMLLLCNRYQPMLEQWRQGLPIHPAQMHAELVKFAGELRTLDAHNRRAEQFSAYSQLDIAASLEPVIEEIRRALNEWPGEDGIPIKLGPVKGGPYLGADLTDSRITAGGYFVLAARAAVTDDELRAKVPNLVKIGAPADVHARVDSLEGVVRLQHLPVPPSAIRYENGCLYFRMMEDPGAETLWKNIWTQRRILLHASVMPGLEFPVLWWVPTR